MPVSQVPSGHMALYRLADGVYAAIRTEPLSLAGNANSLIVVRESDVVVVDAQFTREATLETLAAIRGVTTRPVGVVVISHWHDDHAAGSQVYRDSFPSARFIMQANTAADFATIGRPNRAGTVSGAPPLADRFERLLGLGLGIDSTPVSPDERTAVTHALRIMRRYLAEAPAFVEVMATDTVQHRLTLRDGGRTIDLKWFGCANTRGDLVTVLPDEGIVATGDLVVVPAPFAFNAYPATWIAALDSLLAAQPRLIVPGHGPLQRDQAYVRKVRDMLSAATDSASAAAARGDSARVAARALRLEEFRVTTPGDAKWRDYLFDQFFLRPAFARAYERAACS